MKTIDATVPGNVELDLLAAGLIEQPEIGSNVYDLRPWEGYQWRYSRTFATPEHANGDRIRLNFNGIDCYADIWVNGRQVGSADNMLIEHRFDVTEALKPAGEENTLEVYIRSSVIEAASTFRRRSASILHKSNRSTRAVRPTPTAGTSCRGW